MNQELLKTLCMCNSPSGHEDKIRQIIMEEIKNHVDEMEVDILGNIIARKKGNGKKMMLAAHMDQIGFLVHHIDQDGYIYFSQLGGFDVHYLYGQRIVFQNGIKGVIQAKRMEDTAKELKFDKLYIDIGAKSREEAEKYVSIGDVAVYDAQIVIDDLKVMTPALDDRVGCFVLIELIKQLKSSVYDLYFAFTVQEEVGLRGATTAAYAIEPDYGIAYDVTLSYDTPNALCYPMKFGEGVCIKIKDRSILCHPKMLTFMKNVAIKHEIPHQFEILDFGGTDSGAIHLSKAGVISGVLSIACRNVHTNAEICSLNDIQHCIDLSLHLLSEEIE